MEVREIDPSELEVDPLNERSENIGPYKRDESLEESIKEQGLIQPPIVRRDGVVYKVVVGQRRTLAAQTVGLDSIPVIIVDWNDSEALQASITENVDAFRKRVSKSDRADAIRKLIELNNWNIQKISDELGVSSHTISKWIERTRDEWQDTVVHVDSSGESTDSTTTNVETNPSNSTELSTEDVEQISDTDLQTIRRSTESSEDRKKVVREVVEKDISRQELREAKKRAERGEGSFTEVIEQVSRESNENEGELKVETRVTFSGDYAKGLRQAAKDRGTSEEEIVRGAINEYLMEEGYI